jgi:DUF1680 family protein
MKASWLWVFAGILFGLATQAQTFKDYPIRNVPFTDVKLAPGFWQNRLETNRVATIPASFYQCEKTNRIKNFAIAAKLETGKFCTRYPFDDTDIYKTIEGASYTLSTRPDPKLDKYVDSLIALVGKAQEPDGYLYTARTIDPVAGHNWMGANRWDKEREHSHELYNSGHLYEAAAAHYLATGKRNLLDIAIKNADLVESVFGEAKRHVAPGHQVIEMGLVKLYRVTGKEKYLHLAKYFLDERGRHAYDAKSKDVYQNGSYWQDHLPVVSQTEAVGHAVRAVYMYSGMADVAAIMGNPLYTEAIDKLWENVVSQKMYVNGAIGAAGDGERFGEAYELPNATAYCETCAAIGNVFWNHRMFMLHGDAKYIDILERILYNGLLSGVSLDGKSFFYSNALEIASKFSHIDMETKRSEWFTCSCCPTNMTRLMPSIPGYIYAQRDNQLYVNLFVASQTDVTLANKLKVNLVQQNNYPWEGTVSLTVNPAKKGKFAVAVRIPGWSVGKPFPSDLYTFLEKKEAKPVLKLNGTEVAYTLDKGYAVLDREWRKGDKIELILPMDIQRVVAHEKIIEDRGKVALQRGPLVYCAEWVDNNGTATTLVVPDNSPLTAEFKPELLNGVMVLKGESTVVKINEAEQNVSTQKQPFMAIPYYAWAHRGQGEMAIWLPRRITGVKLYSE